MSITLGPPHAVVRRCPLMLPCPPGRLPSHVATRIAHTYLFLLLLSLLSPLISQNGEDGVADVDGRKHPQAEVDGW